MSGFSKKRRPSEGQFQVACNPWRDDYYLTNRILVKNPLSNVNFYPIVRYRSCR